MVLWSVRGWGCRRQEVPGTRETSAIALALFVRQKGLEKTMSRFGESKEVVGKRNQEGNTNLWKIGVWCKRDGMCGACVCA